MLAAMVADPPVAAEIALSVVAWANDATAEAVSVGRDHELIDAADDAARDLQETIVSALTWDGPQSILSALHRSVARTGFAVDDLHDA